MLMLKTFWVSVSLLCLPFICFGQDRSSVGDAGCFENTVIQSTQFVNFESSDYPTWNGIYIRNDSAGIVDCGYNCSFNWPYYFGTYIYYLDTGSNVYYMFETGLTTEGSVFISDTPCDDITYNIQLEFGPFSVFSEPKWTSIVEQEEGDNRYVLSWTERAGTNTITVVNFCDSEDGVFNSVDGGCPTLAPSNQPTEMPIPVPTASPTQPSISPSHQPTAVPSPPTMSPTTAPSTSPTGKPTHLPSESSEEFLATDCNGLSVLYLDNAFPTDQSDDKFSIIDGSIYNGRSRWINSKGVEIYYSIRFNNRHWVITNGSYTLIREDPTNSSLPGEGLTSYDHFPNDNIYASADTQYTLLFECFNTSYPTASPVIEPTEMPTPPEPTNMPLAPTAQPTIDCEGLRAVIEDINCIETVSIDPSRQSLGGKYQNQISLFNNHLWFRGVDDGQGGNYIYYNEVYEKWVVDSENDYALIEDDDDESYDEVYPPNGARFIFKKSTDNFFPGCYVNFTYDCVVAFPTRVPSNADPTEVATDEPSPVPTMTPTGVPSQPPTTAPTHSPTIGPTSAPTQLCGGLYLTGAFNETGEYNQGDGQINERNWWFNINNDATLFYSPSVLHETWVLYSPLRSEYYLSVNTPPEQPASGQWDFYIGASPFIEETVYLELDCQDGAIPTPLPTVSPTVIPTEQPFETSPPTLPPVDCDFAFISINDTNNLYGGEYFSQDTISRSDIGKLSWTSMTDSSIGIFYNEPYWYLGTEDTSDDTSLIIREDNYKPPDGGLWQYNEIVAIPETTEEFTMDLNGSFTSTQMPQVPSETQIIGEFVFVDFDCGISIEPSNFPSDVPSNQPSSAPTSGCLTLEFTTSADLGYSGNYYKQNTLFYGRSSWSSTRLNARIAYDDGNARWYVADATTFAVILVETESLASSPDYEYFPPSGNYTILSSQQTINVTTQCYPDVLPTPQPTTNPTSVPTVNDLPYWVNCDSDNNNYFDFAVDGPIVAYWDEPVATEDSSGVVTVSNAEGYKPGNSTFGPGTYTITYTATDSNGAQAESTCDINLYIIGGATSSSYQTCLDDDFSISVSVNQSNYIMDTDGIEITESLSFVGMVSNQELGEDNQNCYVQLTQVVRFEEESSGAGATDITGNLQEFNYWEIIIIVVVLWLVILSCVVARCVYKLRNQKVALDADKLLAETAAEAGDASIYAGIADGHMMRKATLTGGAVVGGVGASPVHQSSQPQNYQLNRGNNNDDMKMGDVELGTITPGGGGGPGPAIGAAVIAQPRPSEKLENEKIVVPTNQPYWQRELDYLGAKGYVDEKESLNLLIKNAVKYAGKIDKSATAIKVEKMLDKEREDLMKSNAVKSGVQKEWDNQEADQLNAPQAAIAPPTMSSLVDSSNVLLDDDDEDVLKGIVHDIDTRKGSQAIPNHHNNNGAPPAPVPPPVNGQRPKRADIGNPRESTHLDL